MRRPSAARRWRSNRSWPTTTPPSPTSADDLAGSHVHLGVLLSATGKPSEAEAECRKALASTKSWSTTTPPFTEFRFGLAWSHTSLGGLLSNTGKSSEAEAEYRKALAIHQKLVDDNPAVTEFRLNLASSHDEPRRAAVEYGQVIGSGGRVRQGAGDPAEAG